MTKIGIINYNMGNLGSIKRKFDLLGVHSDIISNYKILKNYDKLIFPGVGHFAMGVRSLKGTGLWDEMNEQVLINKKQILGICLGMQLMARHGEEGDVDGLGWFDADVKRIEVINNRKFKIPHMGWNTLNFMNEHSILKGINENDEFYFVHSYHISMKNHREILSQTEYDFIFTSGIFSENIFGFQFHPEKSHEAGVRLLKNFIEL